MGNVMKTGEYPADFSLLGYGDREKVLDIELLAEKLVRDLRAIYGEGYEVSSAVSRKINSRILHGILIKKKGINVTPSIYLENYYEDYAKGKTSYWEVLEAIRKCHDNNSFQEPYDITFFHEYEKVNKRFVFRVINYEMNRDYLKDMIFHRYLNLAVIVQYMLNDNSFGEATITLRNEHLKLWGVEREDVFAQARKNSPFLCPAVVMTMEELLKNKFSGRMDGLCAPQMYVVTNKRGCNGAGVVFYDGLLSQLSEQLQNNLFILPSSVHEMIIVPDSEKNREMDFKTMVSEINHTQLMQDEILSDYPYYYERMSGNITML